MDKLEAILKDFNKTAYKPTTEEVLQSEIERVEVKVDTLDTNLTSKIEDIKSELTDKVETALAIAETTKKEKGDKGDSYVLTESDKLDIAKQIKVPVVEKVIERTETIRELPTVTENTIVKEVAVKDTGEEILAKINELPVKEEYQIDASRIKNLPEIQNVRAGGLSKAYADKLYQPIGSTSATTWGSITGTVSDQTDLWAIVDAKLSSSWETVALNLYPYGQTITYNGDGDVSEINYGSITKTFNYTDGNVTSIVLSGTLPPGLQTTKTFTYDGNGDVDTITYS